MSVGCRRNAAVIGSLSLLSSLLFATWTPLTSGVTSDLNAVHFPESTEVGYAVGGLGVILKTTDGGGTWVPQTSGTSSSLNAVYFRDNSTGVAVGNSLTAVKTTDGGATWNPVTVPGGGLDLLRTVQFPGNGQTGYIGETPMAGGGRVLKTTDGGDNWSQITIAGMHQTFGCGFATEDLGLVWGDAGLLLRTVDGCGNFGYLGPGTILDIVTAAFIPDDPAKAYVLVVDGTVRYTADTGSTWQAAGVPPSMEYLGISLCGGGSTVGYIVGAAGEISKTYGGTGFLKSPSGVTSPLFSVCFPAGESTGYVVGTSGVILKTTDGGEPTVPGVAEGRSPALSRTGIRVVSNPSRHGIALHSDADVAVAVFDATGRVLMSQAATKGLNFLPLRKPGAYIVKAGAETARVVVTD